MRCFPAAVFCCLLLFCIAPSQADAPASGTLLVTVHDRNRMPRAAIRLTLQPLGRTTTTNRNGAASFTALPPGSYTLSLAPPSYFPMSQPVTLAANASSGIDFLLSPNGVVEITMHDATGRRGKFIVPPVLRPVNPPTEYLLTPPVPPGSGPAWRKAQEDTLMEATARYLFAVFPPEDDWHPKVYYLAINGFPSDQEAEAEKDKAYNAAFLKRFRNNRPPVKNVFSLTQSKDWRKQGRHQWIVYGVGISRWISDTVVEVGAGKSQSGYPGGGGVYLTCTLRNGWWEISDVFISVTN